MKSPGYIGLGVFVFVLVMAGGFFWAQTRVIERPPTQEEHEAMVTLEALTGAPAPEGTGAAEELVRAFPSMPMLWLNYRRSGPIQVRSHLLRYDDEAQAITAVERFQAGDSEWLASLRTSPMDLPDCVDAGFLDVAEGEGFVLTARRGGSYVHVSALGWAPTSPAALAKGLCANLDRLEKVAFPPE